MNPSPIAALVLVAVIGLTTAGCDVAEESAQKLTDKAEQAVQDIAREAVSDTLNAFNEQIDQVQKSTSELLGQPEDEAGKDQPERDAEKPSPSFKEGVET
ncbi:MULTISPECIES: hypothetical protein [Pseudomonas]|uniref:Lipoprotein n=2 Tax=Pseudomonadaceae TaxID=135621 RepID=A0A0D0IA07_9PSED|nr:MULTISPECIES: hypothetical protein [Pseudomonas]KIP89697.1 lipoprotein [Pseudomonas fulva]MCW2290754.1 hypothetical protein [Pseudomonas sp. BIGb0408]NYH74673.1 hypothetical protein [Pseudomonas flavescens]